MTHREGTTLFMTLLAAFQTLLYGHTKQSDIVVGSPVANRNREEIEGLVGFFVNTLVLRTRLSDELTFRTLLARVREVCLEAYDHQDLPFEMIVASLNPQRELGVAPLFQVMFSLQNESEDALALPGLQVTRLTPDRETSKFDLSLYLLESADGLVGSLRCALDLFERAAADAMATQFQRLLERIIADPNQRLAELLQPLELAGTLRPRSTSSKAPQQDSHPTGQNISRRPPTAPLELSFVQERMWVLHQLEPESPVFNRPKGIRLQGYLNVSLLSRAIQGIVARHEIMRLAVPAKDGKPVPIVNPDVRVNLPLLDLSGLPERQAEQQATKLAEEEAERPFDLATAPLLRAKLLRIGTEDHVLLLTFHHIISDAWSDSVFWRELEYFYNGFCSGQSPQLPEPGIQYSDFAYWQRQMLEGKRLEEHSTYWRKKISGPLPVLNLPLDRPRPAFLASRGARRSLQLDPELSEALKAFSRREGVTLFTTLLAAFNTLLFRYTGQEDLLVGTPVAGRTTVELEGLIGPVLRTLVLRNDVSGNSTFRELLGRIRQTTLEAMSRQDLPFEKLLETLQPDRALSHSPIFQVLFNFRNVPTQPVSLNQLSATDFPVESSAALFDIDFEITERNGTLQCSVRYQEALFDSGMVSGFLGHFRSLLEAIVSVPTQRLAELPLLNRIERQEILEEWSERRDFATTSACVHEMFETQTQRAPEAPGIVFEGAWLTYRELSDRSNQLARYLQGLGVRPETRVGLCMERSPELIVGLLGILKAGGAFVPLDPDYPQQRLSFMVDDARLEIILTHERQTDRFENNSNGAPGPKSTRSSPRTIVALDRDWKKVSQESRATPANTVSPDNLAYVIYTSGSTGRPKGVMISHRALAACIESVVSAYEIEPADRILQFASITFDASLEEIFGSLTRGATLVLRSESMIESPREFLRLCGLMDVTVLDLPTAYWHQLTSTLHDQELEFPHCLRLVVIGGERALPNQLAAWIKRGPRDVRLVNSYGPTEVTITATAGSLSQAEAPVSDVPIGQPLGHASAFVLDGQLQPVPQGLAGELCLSGASLARGYLNRPDTTADYFIPNPYGAPGTRLYKTGDRVRHTRDGQLVFLGRLDHQVKVRGFRIELGEVEAAVVDHPGVRDCAVVTQEDTSRNAQLAAFAVVENREALSPAELRRFLKFRLPDYMVPGALYIVDALPLTSSGKVDRRALQASPIQAAPERDYVAPRTPVEEALAGMWRQLLKREEVGVRDNFFELGGHSLLGTQLIARVYQGFGIHLPLRRLFETPTIADLALAIVEQKAEQAGEATLNEILTELEKANPRLEDPAERTS